MSINSILELFSFNDAVMRKPLSAKAKRGPKKMPKNCLFKPIDVQPSTSAGANTVDIREKTPISKTFIAYIN